MGTQDEIVDQSRAGPPGRSPTLSDVGRAYRLFLGRELESSSIAGFHICNSPDLWGLIEIVSGCPEARNRSVSEAMARVRTLHGLVPPEIGATSEEVDELRRVMLDAWSKRGLGQYYQLLRISEQHYAARSGRWNLEKAIERGNAEAADFVRGLNRLGRQTNAGATITVLGVEAFRMIEAARQDEFRFVGVELLESDLLLAQRAAEMASAAPAISLSIRDYAGGLPQTDIFYSVSALQYAPPPVMLDILRRCLGQVRLGGIAAFQLPCHLHDYQFNAAAYLSGEDNDASGGLHCVPQSRILSLLSEEGFRLLEVVPDERTAILGFSYFFVAEKALPDMGRPQDRAPENPKTNKEMIVNQLTITSDLETSVNARQWFHRIELGNGVTTPGADDTPYKLTALCLPDDLTGKTVLDVGAWDGFFSFECERRGAARIVASDSYCWNGEGIQDGGGFRLAHAALGSRVAPLNSSVEALDPEVQGTFDYVLFLGVLYHATDPLGYLAKMRSLCRGTTVLETWVDGLEIDRPALIFYPGAVLNNDASNYFGPNEAAVIAMCKEVGFSDVEVVNRHFYPNRMVFHAHV